MSSTIIERRGVGAAGGALLAVGALVAVTTLNRIQASALVGAAPAGSREKRAPRPRGAEPASVSIR